MRMIDGGLRLSASDLMRFKVCRHVTTLDLRRIEDGDIAPAADDAEAAVMQHEPADVQHQRRRWGAGRWRRGMSDLG